MSVLCPLMVFHPFQVCKPKLKRYKTLGVPIQLFSPNKKKTKNSFLISYSESIQHEAVLYLGYLQHINLRGDFTAKCEPANLIDTSSS